MATLGAMTWFRLGTETAFEYMVYACMRFVSILGVVPSLVISGYGIRRLGVRVFRLLSFCNAALSCNLSMAATSYRSLFT